MAKVTGTLTGNVNMGTPRSLGVSMASNRYPNGTVTFTNIKAGGAYWKNNHTSQARSADIYLCDKNGNHKHKIFTVSLSADGTNTTTKSGTVSGASDLAGKALYVVGGGSQAGDIIFRNTSPVEINYSSLNYTVALAIAAPGGGNITASATSVQAGSTVTLYPSPNTGYQVSSLTAVKQGGGSVTITNNQFTMPSENVSVTVAFSKINYAITKVVNPTGAGAITAPATANYGDTVSVSASANSGYKFKNWSSSPAVTISNGAFTMPASAVTLTANYMTRSTAALNTLSLTGGGTAVLTITQEKSTYCHSYQLSFGTGMQTQVITLAADVTSVTIDIPASWSSEIPNSATKTGGTLTVWTYEDNTYSGGSIIGSYQITGLTYNVPASAVPTVGAVTASVARTIGSTTFANVGDVFVQNKCGVRIQASPAGASGSTITSIAVSISGYTGTDYNKTVSASSLDVTSGILNIAGTTEITVTATDSRGRTGTETVQITVLAYNSPAGSLEVWRVDSNGDPDDLGEYAKFSCSYSWSAVGSNSLTAELESDSGNTYSVTSTPITGANILPGSGNREQFGTQAEHIITLTLEDSFETTVITAKLPSAKYIIYVDEGGDKLAIMKAATHSIPAGKTSVIEFSADSEIYIGNETLAEYIARIVQGI